MPLHYTVIIAWAITSLTLNVYGHLGFELLPKNFTRHKVGKWFNTSVHHNMHHKFFNDNYSLYFTFWDRIMGTLHPQYDNYFDQVVARRQKADVSKNITMTEEREKVVSAS
jgi:sterol desaturase/sphingolipid hydroxylase (fatty acid hydroxylase superfamily)